MQSRRQFLRQSAGSALGLAATTPLTHAQSAPTSETLVKTLYDTLTDGQREAITFPFDHQLRSAVDNNWHITGKENSIDAIFSADQQAMCREIFLNLHSEEYRDEVLKQVEHDNGRRGFGYSSVGFFGEPGTDQFEFVLTARHTTRRCDGNSVEGKAFGGPIFYGHAAEGFHEEPHHPGNAYWFQALRANELFHMLDGKQQEQSLLGSPRPERGTSTVRLKKRTRGLEGLAAGDMTVDQREHLQLVLKDLLMPFRKEDVEESMRLIEKAGVEDLHLSFYKDHDLGNDGVYDTWQIEGPHMIWMFRGRPHVHTWVHISDPDLA